MHDKSINGSVPSTPDSSSSKTSEQPLDFLNVFPRGPKNCTEEDLKSIQKQRLFDSQEDVEIDKEPSLNDEGFIVIEKKISKNKPDGSPRATRGQRKKN